MSASAAEYKRVNKATECVKGYVKESKFLSKKPSVGDIISKYYSKAPLESI